MMPGKITIAFILILFVFFLFGQTFPKTASVSDADALLARVQRNNEKLQDFTSNLKIDVRVLAFDFRLDGKMFFKKPNRVKIEYESVPGFLKNKKGLFKDMMPGSLKMEDFETGAVMEEEFKGELCEKVILVPRKKDKIDGISLWVEKKHYTVRGADIRYVDDSRIRSVVFCEKVEGFFLPIKQEIDFDIPSFRATAKLEFKDYRVNVGLSDEIFSQKAMK